jgi:glutathione S-transferase
MTRRRRLIHAVFLLLLPVVVAVFQLGVLTAVLLVLAALLWRWLIVLSGMVSPEPTPHMVLDSIGVSHFVEKVRWCMDRLGVDYVEQQSGGTLGAYFTGRTVPQLRVRTGIVQSVISNSAEILRYLWGSCSAPLGEGADFLRPTPERLALEQQFDRYGVNLQVWVYYHLLPHRELTLHAWGVDSSFVPGWQRRALRVLQPLLAILIRRSFAITDERFARAVLKIEELLSDIDTRLADGRRSILGGDEVNYTDIAFAAMCGVWLQPELYSGGKGAECRLERASAPALMRADIERWLEDYPKAAAFTERLYAEQRMAHEATAGVRQ